MATITLEDLSLRNIRLSPQLEALREAYFQAVPEICTERARLITACNLEAGLFERERITALNKARLYRRALENRLPVVRHSKAHRRAVDGMAEFTIEDASPFAGSTTTKFKGVPIYPEFLALALWPELETISPRSSNPY